MKKIHFAYPNVLPRQSRFIGCGRYAVFTSNETPDDPYREIIDAPNTPNKNSLKRAIQMLGSESYASKNGVFEKRDQSRQNYQGDSLDLAYLLAHLHRSRPLKLKIEGDIWCTGIIQVDGSSPHLLDVDPTGFKLKLDQFLSKENQDPLFIAPMANFNRSMRALADEKNTAIVSWKIFDKKKTFDLSDGKTILAVPADQLALLVNRLFGAPKTRSAKKWPLIIGLSVIVLAAGVFFFYRQPSTISHENNAAQMEPGEINNTNSKIATIKLQENKSSDNIKKNQSEPYIKRDDGTILDKNLGLVWRQKIEGIMSWLEALEHVKKINKKGLMGRHDWRIPNKGELLQVARFSKKNKGFFSPDDLWCWSSTQHGLLTAWLVNLGHADVEWDDFDEWEKSEDFEKPYAVRLVRSINSQE